MLNIINLVTVDIIGYGY